MWTLAISRKTVLAYNNFGKKGWQIYKPEEYKNDEELLAEQAQLDFSKILLKMTN